MTHLFEAKQNLPLGTKQLAEDTERRLYSGLRKTVNDWFDTVNKTTDVYDALAELRFNLYDWKGMAKADVKDNVQELYRRGLQAGAKETGEPVVEKLKKLNDTMYKDSGIMPAVDKFADETFDKISKIMLKYWDEDKGHRLFSEKRDIDSWMSDQRFRTEKMLRTETAKVANWGLIQSWGEDAGRDYYIYYWINPEDERSKTTSIIRKQGNPYSYNEIKFLYEHQIQKIGNFWEDDSYFQRCSIARRRVAYKNESNRFRGQEFNYKRTLPR